MLFTSYSFLLFFPIVCLVYFLLPKKIRWVWLLLSSYYFYISWDVKYAVLLLVITLGTFFGALFLEKTENDVKRKWILALGIALNLVLLCVFKYSNFLLNILNNIANALGMNPVREHPFDIVLPVGISFYTFQAIGYNVDVYRREEKAERNFFKYALFVSFFPQILSGPIARAKNLLKQINDKSLNTSWDYQRVTLGLITMVWGFFLKIVVSDRIAFVVDEAFNHYENYGFGGLFLGALAYTIQIYTDFAGYSTIAVGAGKVLGFELIENFNTPYFATSIADFWRRWHISLSTWFRDYLYIPLGGNRKGKIKKYRNLLITFLLSGLWHGADWSFVLWGGIHGIYQIIGDLIKPIKLKIGEMINKKIFVSFYNLIQRIITFLLVSFAWIFFRASDSNHAFGYIKQMLIPNRNVIGTGNLLLGFGLDETELIILGVLLIILFICSIVSFNLGVSFPTALSRQWLPVRWVVLLILLVACVILGIYGPGTDTSQFIYLQF